MCLIVLAWRVRPDFPLIVAANRDEFHARPAQRAGFWKDRPGILGGRDLEANGTWMGVSRAGAGTDRTGGAADGSGADGAAVVSDRGAGATAVAAGGGAITGPGAGAR